MGGGKMMGLWLGMISAVLFLFLGAMPTHALSNTADSGYWGTDGEIYTMVTTGTKAYIGGNFRYVGEVSGGGVVIDKTTGSIETALPKANDRVNLVIPDGADGWYIAGDFTKVGGEDRLRLAHILSDGTVDGWNPSPNNSVNAMVLAEDGTLYVGGQFTTIASTGRGYLAAFDSATGGLLSWDPSLNGGVFAMAATGTTLYVGGGFNLISSEGTARNYLAAFDTVTGDSTAWDPSLDSTVQALVLSEDGTVVYTGGSFSSVGGDSRNYLAAIDTVTGSSTAWDPSPDNQVTSLLANGSDIYVGGYFGLIGGETRIGLAEIDSLTGLATAWDPGADSNVNSMLLDGTTLYVAGNFTTLGGAARYYLGAIDTATALATAWQPSINQEAETLAFNPSRSKIYAGGYFMLANGFWRDYIAEIDLNTKKATSWNSGANSEARALVLSPDGNMIYAGGSFTVIGGQSRNRIAALDRTTGLATAWDPDADSTVYALAVSPDGNTIYAGGDIANIGGEPRTQIAAIDGVSGLPTSWAPSLPYTVRSIALNKSGSVVYIGEYHYSCTFPFPMPPRCRYAGNVDSINAADASTNWSDAADRGVLALAVDPEGTAIYAGGEFSGVDVGTDNYLAKLDAATGAPMDWVSADGIVRSLTMDTSGKVVFAGGSFATIGGASRAGLAAVEVDGTVKNWNPGTDGNVYSLAYSQNGNLLIGGAFTEVGSQFDYNLAGFTAPTLQFSTASSNGASTVAYPTITVSMDKLDADDVRVNYAATGGTATSGYNYKLVDGTLSIPAGSLSANIPLQILNSPSTISNPTVVMSLSNPQISVLGAKTAHTYTINISTSGGGGSSGGGGGGIYYMDEPPKVPAEGFKVTIDGGAAIATSRVVMLDLVGHPTPARDPIATKMSISNTSDFRGAIIQPYAEKLLWDMCKQDGRVLPCEAGTRSVYVKFYTDYGTASEVVSDEISYVPTYINAISGVQTTIETKPGTLIPPSIKFSRDLVSGMTGSDVKELQKFLNANGFIVAQTGPGSPGNETSKFGAGTRTALTKFQEAYAVQILTPVGLKRGTGQFRASTRKFVNNIK